MTIRHTSPFKNLLCSFMPAGMRALSIWWDAVLTLACSLALLILILFVKSACGFFGGSISFGYRVRLLCPWVLVARATFPASKGYQRYRTCRDQSGTERSLDPTLGPRARSLTLGTAPLAGPDRRVRVRLAIHAYLCLAACPSGNG